MFLITLVVQNFFNHVDCLEHIFDVYNLFISMVMDISTREIHASNVPFWTDFTYICSRTRRFCISKGTDIVDELTVLTLIENRISRTLSVNLDCEIDFSNLCFQRFRRFSCADTTFFFLCRKQHRRKFIFLTSRNDFQNSINTIPIISADTLWRPNKLLFWVVQNSFGRSVEYCVHVRTQNNGNCAFCENIVLCYNTVIFAINLWNLTSKIFNEVAFTTFYNEPIPIEVKTFHFCSPLSPAAISSTPKSTPRI